MLPTSAADEEVPRARDVGLLLAGNALAALHHSGKARDAVLHGLHEWYLCRVCFADVDLDRASRPAAFDDGQRPPDVFRQTEDIDFHLASFNASRLTCTPCATAQTPADAISQQGGRSVADRPAGGTPSAAQPDAGLAVLLHLVRHAFVLGGPSTAHFLSEYLVKALLSTAGRAAHGEQTLGDGDGSVAFPRAQVDISTLTALFTGVCVDDNALWSLGSATSSYRVWACVAWNGASFPHQTALTQLVSRWAQPLRQMRDEYTMSAVGSPPCGRPDDVSSPSCTFSVSQRASSVPLPHAGDGDVSVPSQPTVAFNLRATYTLLRRLMEGLPGTNGAVDTRSIRSLLAGNAAGENYAAKLLALQGPALSRTVLRGDVEHQGTVATLFQITTGMLLYVQFHLCLRALAAARHCAQMAVLVAHQIHSDELLALARYSQFVVHLASGSPLEAADSLSVAMHLSCTSTRAEVPFAPLGVSGEATSHDTGEHTASLCYLAAAQLLLLFPSAVGAPLRSAMTSSTLWQAMTRRAQGEDDENQDFQAFASARYDPALTTSTSAAAVSQTIAESVQQALWLSEVEALYRAAPPCRHWISLVIRISRETVRMIGAVYGIVSVPQRFTVETIQVQLDHIAEEERVSPTAVGAMKPQTPLLSEMTRHTAYCALVGHEGYLQVHPAAAPLSVLQDFRDGVRAAYGEAGLTRVDTDEFFAGVTRYLVAVHSAQQGYIARAYESLTALVAHLCHLSGLEFLSASVRAEQPTAVSGDARETDSLHAVETHSSPDAHMIRHFSSRQRGCASPEATVTYWSADWLFLLAHVQLKRAELAAYLGYVTRLDDMAASLEQVCLHYHFTLGVLSARVIHAQALTMRLRYSDAQCELSQLAAACVSTGLYGFLKRVYRDLVSVAMQVEMWDVVMHTLQVWEQHNSPPLSAREQWWVLRVRLEVVCRVSEWAVGDSLGRDDPEGQSVLHWGLKELARHPCVAPFLLEDGADDRLAMHPSTLCDSHETALIEETEIWSTFLHATICLGEPTPKAATKRLVTLLALLQDRQQDLADRKQAS